MPVSTVSHSKLNVSGSLANFINARIVGAIRGEQSQARDTNDENDLQFM